MLDLATTTSANVHALTGSSRPGAVPAFSPVTTAPALQPTTSLHGLLGNDAEIIDLAGRVKVLADRHARVYLRMLVVQGRLDRWHFANRPKAPEPAPSETSVVRSRTETHEVTQIEQPLRVLAVRNARDEAHAAAVAAHDDAVDRKRARTREPYLDKLQARMWRRLEGWTIDLTQRKPTTQAALAAKAAASLAVNEAADGMEWAKELSKAISADALRIICADTDARAEQDRQADGELLALGRVWEVSADQHDRAVEHQMSAEEDLKLPDVPEVLFADPQRDAPTLGAYSRVHGRTGRRWYGDTGTVERLRRPWHHDFCRARRDEILVAYDEWVAARKAEEDACGLPSAREQVARLCEENLEMRRRILAIPARTTAGLLLKLRVARWCMGDISAMEADLETFLEDGKADDDAFALAVVLDASRLLQNNVSLPAAAVTDAGPEQLEPIEFPRGRYLSGVPREVVESYRTFLTREMRFLDHEIYGRHEGRLHLWLDNPAGRMHGGREPAPSTRAAAVLGVLGLMPTLGVDGAAQAAASAA